MKKLRWLKVGAWMLAGFSLGTAVVAQEDLMSKMINPQTNGSWYFQPEKPKARHFKVPELPGGYAFRVKASKGVNPWDKQASSPIDGAINEGDVIMINYYARAEVPAEGGSHLTVRIQLGAPPWNSVLETSSPITGEWKSYCAFRVANASIGEKKGNVSIHLATAEQVIDLGPVLVFNFGKAYDQNKLKFCTG